MELHFKRFPILIATTLAALLLAACTTEGPAAPASEEAGSAEPQQIEPWDGDGMDIPLDGSSLEAFDHSMARVKAYASEPDYTTLVSAIDYLLAYDLSARRDRARLAANLNGLTGHQIVTKVDERMDR